MLINSPNISGSLTVTGNSVITGSLTVLGGINGAITGSATTASYVEYSNVANKPTLVSGSSQVSFNGITDKPTLVSGSSQVSFNGITDKPTLVSGSSQVTYSGLTGIPAGIVSGSAQIADFGIFATTGSNQFNGNQAITGSLTTTGTIVAQTLNVQQVTSSIVYSSGSNIFGNDLGNTQQFTGSVSITGSLNTSIAAFGSAATTFLTSDGGVIKSRTAAQTLSDIAALPLAGGTLTGALNGTSATFSSTAFINSPFNNTVITTSDATNIANGFNLLASTSYWGIRTATGGDFKLDVFGAGVPKNALSIAQSTGAATFSSSVTATNELSILAGDGAGKKLYFTGGTTKYNFMIAAQQNVDNALEITPSTAAGGSTFSTPALTIASTGAATFTGALNGTSAVFTGNIDLTAAAPTLTVARTTGVGYIGNLTGGSYVAIYGDSHATKPNFTEIVGAGGIYVLNAATFSSSVTASGAISNDFSAGSTFAASFTNSNSTGYGLYVRGGSNVREAILIANYAGNQNIRLYGDGSATFSSSVTASGIISSEDVRIYRSASNTTGYINFGSTGTNYFGWGGSDFVFNGNINAGGATFSSSVTVNSSVNIVNYTTGSSLFVGGAATNGVSNGIILLQSGRVPQSGGDTTGTNGLLFQHTISGATTVAGGYIENGRENVFGSTSDVNTFISFATTLANINNERLRIASGGNIYMYGLAAGAGTNAVRFSTATGQLTYDTSSARYKDNIRESIYGINDVMKLKSSMFEYKEDGRTDIGLIAEEVYEVIPELVALDKDGNPDAVSYDRFISVLVKAIQELKAENDTLKSRIDTLEQA